MDRDQSDSCDASFFQAALSGSDIGVKKNKRLHLYTILDKFCSQTGKTFKKGSDTKTPLY